MKIVAVHELGKCASAGEVRRHAVNLVRVKIAAESVPKAAFH